MVFTDVAPGLALPQSTIDEAVAGGTSGDIAGRGEQLGSRALRRYHSILDWSDPTENVGGRVSLRRMRGLT